MSLSKESRVGAQPGIIKRRNSLSSKINIIDYKTIVEEIHQDKKRDVKIDLTELAIKSPDQSQGAVVDRGDTNSDDGNSQEDYPGRDRVAMAYEEGFESGKAETAKALQAEYGKKVEEVSKEFKSVIETFAKEVERYNREVDRAVLTLALAVAKRIVAREIVIDESAVLARYREAIRKIIGVDKIKIRINPADEEYIREHRNELSNYVDSVREIVIEADSKVERGGCIIESELGNIDARISTQFELLEEALLGLVKQ